MGIATPWVHYVAPKTIMMLPDYIHCYSTLQLRPGCNWHDVRERYRLLVKQWHPDHFQTETERRTADEKIKAINNAFHLLAQHYRHHHTLPMPAPDPLDRPSGMNTPSQTVTPAAAADTAPTARTKAASRIPMRYAAILAATAAALVAWLQQSATTPAPHGEPATVSIEREHTAQAKTSQAYFTFGSTLGEVHAVQGIPTRIEHNVWYYGNATVQFNDGVVVGWNDDPSGLPLKARLDAQPKSHAHHFGVGSSKADVMAVQGRPTQMTDAVWDYGSSRVYFRGDHVASWDNSPLNPLKVH